MLFDKTMYDDRTTSRIRHALYWDKPENIRELFTENPSLMWMPYGELFEPIASRIIRYNHIELLDFMYNLILQQLTVEQLLFAAFEGTDKDGNSPIHIAARHNNSAIEWLTEHCPRGAAILEVKNHIGNTPAHEAARLGKMYNVEYIALHAQSGLATFFTKNIYGQTPIEVADSAVKSRMLSADTQRLGLVLELRTLKLGEFPDGSLPSLMFDVLRQNLEVQLWKLTPSNMDGTEFMKIVRENS